MRLLVLAGCVLVLVSACRKTDELPPGWIASAVKQAKAEGRRAIELRAAEDEEDWHTDLPLRFALHRNAVVLVAATGRTVITPRPNDIVTWHVFRQLEYVLRSDMNPEQCHIGKTPEALALARDEIAFPRNQGTIDVHGVRVSMASPDSDVVFQPGTKFLIIVRECQGGIVTLPFGRRGMFPLSSEGDVIRIRTPEDEMPRFAAEVQALGTIARFRERAKELRRLSGPLSVKSKK